MRHAVSGDGTRSNDSSVRCTTVSDVRVPRLLHIAVGVVEVGGAAEVVTGVGVVAATAQAAGRLVTSGEGCSGHCVVVCLPARAEDARAALVIVLQDRVVAHRRLGERGIVVSAAVLGGRRAMVHHHVRDRHHACGGDGGDGG